jgi:hypothetical protein
MFLIVLLELAGIEKNGFRGKAALGWLVMIFQ